MVVSVLGAFALFFAIGWGCCFMHYYGAIQKYREEKDRDEKNGIKT